MRSAIDGDDVMADAQRCWPDLFDSWTLLPRAKAARQGWPRTPHDAHWTIQVLLIDRLGHLDCSISRVGRARRTSSCTPEPRPKGFNVVITNDTEQLSRPPEMAAISTSGLHRIEYRRNNKHGGLVGLGTAIATVCAALSHALSKLEAADGRRLVCLTSIDPTRQRRLQITQPAVTPLKHWLGRDSTVDS
ncbi:hypothetical protein ACWCRD_04865 [Streptomyces sp. NPDC002092]